ncbi:unnamed protein product [Clonostachys rhizophaga]|uniref:NAD(P)-binding protein n=1 Tax=Clonostachys rhizophaga TaxID=160324 RepID=A0A9N9VKN7_9HYPO|nr:unnamed protein product [Clonostachys rhizophaga]
MEFLIDTKTLTGLKDKVVFITGGSKGLGLAAATQFVELGSKVVIADLQPPSRPLEGSVYSYCDVTKWPTLLAAMQETVRLHGSLDVVVANAGIGEVEDVFFDAVDEFTGELQEPKLSVIDVNLKGVINTVKIGIHHMRKQPGGGAIIMTSSSAGYLGEKLIPAYNAAKHGVVGLMRSLRATTEKFNITVNVVAPWMAESNLIQDQIRQVLKENHVEITNAGKVGKAMAYLACRGLNGKTVFVGRNHFTELEDKISELEPQWLGRENSKAWRATNQSNYFYNQSCL